MHRMSDAPTPAHLRATPAIDADHPDVQAFAREHAQGANERERAVALTHAVRDGFRYDPYRIDLSPTGMRASSAWAKVLACRCSVRQSNWWSPSTISTRSGVRAAASVRASASVAALIL